MTGERARRRAARELIGAYHDEQLRGLLEHVRDGFARLDGGEIDAFELDELIHRYKRSARELWKFCGSSGSDWERAAGMLAFLRRDGEEPDWWSAGELRPAGVGRRLSGGVPGLQVWDQAAAPRLVLKLRGRVRASTSSPLT